MIASKVFSVAACFVVLSALPLQTQGRSTHQGSESAIGGRKLSGCSFDNAASCAEAQKLCSCFEESTFSCENGRAMCQSGNTTMVITLMDLTTSAAPSPGSGTSSCNWSIILPSCAAANGACATCCSNYTSYNLSCNANVTHCQCNGGPLYSGVIVPPLPPPPPPPPYPPFPPGSSPCTGPFNNCTAQYAGCAECCHAFAPNTICSTNNGFGNFTCACSGSQTYHGQIIPAPPPPPLPPSPPPSPPSPPSPPYPLSPLFFCQGPFNNCTAQSAGCKICCNDYTSSSAQCNARNGYGNFTCTCNGELGPVTYFGNIIPYSPPPPPPSPPSSASALGVTWTPAVLALTVVLISLGF